MCQYLFAAFSLKQSTEEGLSDAELEAVPRWRRVVATLRRRRCCILRWCTTCSAVGAAPHFARPNFPAPARHYPPGVNLTLVPFGEPALQHFIFLERPEGMELEDAVGIDAPIEEAVPLMAEGDIVPQLQDFATVGHRSIEHGIAHLAEKFGERGCSSARPARRRHRRTSIGGSSSPSSTSSRRSGRSTRSSSKGRCARRLAVRASSASSSRFSTSTGSCASKSGLRPGAPGAVRDGPLGRARRGDTADRRRDDRALHRPLQRRLRDSPADVRALLRAHRGNRRPTRDLGRGWSR